MRCRRTVLSVRLLHKPLAYRDQHRVVPLTSVSVYQTLAIGVEDRDTRLGVVKAIKPNEGFPLVTTRLLLFFL